MEAASDAMSKGYQLNFSGSLSRLSVGTDWDAIRTIAPEHASEEKLWRDRFSRCRALIVWHAYTNDEDTFDRGTLYVQGQDVIDSYVRAYNNDAEHKVRIELLDSSDQIQNLAERDHIVLDREKLAKAVDSLFSELPDVSFEYRDFKAVCVLAIDQSSTTGLLNTLTLKEGMVLRSGTVVAWG